jgi:hypothetical protein
MNTQTEIIIKALRILVNDIQSPDGVPNACVAQAADRLEELQRANKNTLADLAVAIEQRDDALKNQQPTTVAQQLTTRPEPSRLEIAAKLMGAHVYHLGMMYQEGLTLRQACLIEADALIAAAKEAK